MKCIASETSEHLHTDTVIIASHREKLQEQILMGDITENVLHQTTIPLVRIKIQKHV